MSITSGQDTDSRQFTLAANGHRLAGETYDANGNRTSGSADGFTSVAYNILNLPETVTTGGRTINYLYSARWSTPDPLSEKYYAISPYAYCAGNPVNLVDPNGEDWVTKSGSYEFEWMDDVTNPESTPKGYSYVGNSPLDVLIYMGLPTEFQSKESFLAGHYPLDSSAGMGFYGSTIISNLSVTISTCRDYSLDGSNNKNYIRINGITIKATMLYAYAAEDLNITVRLYVYADKNTFERLLGEDKPDYDIRAEGYSIKEARLFIPAHELTPDNNIQKIAIQGNLFVHSWAGNYVPIFNNLFNSKLNHEWHR